MVRKLIVGLALIASATPVLAQVDKLPGCSDEGYEARVANINAYLKLYDEQYGLPEAEHRLVWNGNTYQKTKIYCDYNRKKLNNRLSRLRLLKQYPKCVKPGEYKDVNRYISKHKESIAEDCSGRALP